MIQATGAMITAVGYSIITTTLSLPSPFHHNGLSGYSNSDSMIG
jgi:hypothetical protein